MAGPLDGVRVLDLTRILSGPYCTMMLGDMGADVIKVENPDGGDDTRGWGPPFLNGVSTYYISINRNKRSLTLNLKHERGKEILTELIRQSDVVAENFRPGTLDKLGFSWEGIQRINPRAILTSVSGTSTSTTISRARTWGSANTWERSLIGPQGIPAFFSASSVGPAWRAAKKASSFF